MAKLDWLKELADTERQMEESGVYDFSAGFDPEKILQEQTVQFLQKLNEEFVDYAAAFNQLRVNSIGNIKIYGISNTVADFMLFRNGFKLIFTVAEPGKIAIRPFYQPASFVPGESTLSQKSEAHPHEDQILARWGAFGELIWTHKDFPVNSEYLVRYYLSKFIRESAK